VAEDRLVSVLPLHHAFELTAGLLAPLSVGASITYLETLSSETIVAALRETRATVLLGVPRLFELMLEGIHRQVARLSAGRSVALGALSGASRAFRALGLSAGRSLSPLHARFGGCLRAFVSGGSPLPPEVLEGFRELGFTIVEGYGLTETAPVVAVNPLDGARAGSVGKPLPGVEVRIHAPAEDGVGEIVVRGPNVMSGYYRDPEATARVLRAGWFHTGDLGRFDADSYLYLTGRLKDLIVTSSGKNVYPEEVEVELKDLPGVKESCVVGVRARSGGGEEVHLVVVLEGDDTEAAHAAVRAEVARRGARLSSHQRVQRVHFWTAELPKTALLKVKRGAVKARLEGEEVEPAAGDASLGDEQHPVAREVVAVLARLTRVPLPALRADQSLSFDLGVDSLMRVELAVALEAAGGPRLSDEAVQELSTVRDLLELARIAHPGPRRSRRGALRLPSAESGPRTSAGVAILSKTTAPIVRATWPLLYLRYLDLEVRGRELLPAQGPYILAANHQSHLDAGAVLTALGGESRRLHVVAARDYFFDTPLKGGFFAELMNAIPFDRQGDFAPGLAACRGALEAGDPLLIFPEGTRSPDGRLQEFKAGLGILALELGVPVVPTCIEGTHAAMPKGARFPRRRPVRVTFGDPVDPGAVAPEGDALPYERYRAVVEAVRREIALLAAGRAAVASG
jgi:long-chain acyl-CoA synthetase